MGIQSKALNSLRLAWRTKIREMHKMDQAARVQPENPYQVIRMNEELTDGSVRLDCGPAVFKLRERAGRGNRRIYVVVQGSICVQEKSGPGGMLQTMCFGTKVGYFRSKGDRLDHVYGVHYDMDTRGNGHPVFHGQLGPAEEFAEAVQDRFRVGGNLNNHVEHILRNVRTPTAQMDFFSVVTQLCADHLMEINPAGADRRVTEAFEGVRQACTCLQGAGHRLSRLNSDIASKCYRSSHWYPDQSF